MSGETCPKKRCKSRLDFDRDHRGGIVVTCRACERREAGICRDCPRPVDGKVGVALRCAAHRRARELAAHRTRYQKADKAAWRAAERARIARPGTTRDRRLAAKRAWRAANPDKVRRQKRRAALRQRPATRRKQAYTASQREQKNARARLRWAVMRGAADPSLVARYCDCGSALLGHRKKCDACKAVAAATAIGAVRSVRREVRRAS